MWRYYIRFDYVLKFVSNLTFLH